MSELDNSAWVRLLADADGNSVVDRVVRVVPFGRGLNPHMDSNVRGLCSDSIKHRQ